MKKNILIVIPSLEMGGTTVSLYNLLSLIDAVKYNIDLLPMSPYGSFKKVFINCNILKENVLLMALNVSSNQKLPFLKKVLVIFIKSIRKLFRYFGFDFSKIIFRGLRNRYKNYDAVIAYQEGITTHFVSYLNCKKKITWIQCDYNNYIKNKNKINENSFYNKYNTIVCVSKYTQKSFINCIPFLKERVIVINNTINECTIKNESSKKVIIDYQCDNNTFTILSIGRIEPVKRFSIIPEIVAYLKNENCKFKWYLIGGGEYVKELDQIRQKVSQYGVSDSFIYLGEKINPYVYIAHSNLVVCTSLSESFNYVINEALVLGIPVVTTEFGSAREFINNNQTGLITSIDEIGKTIKLMITNIDYYNKFKINLESYNYNNKMILDDIEQLFN